MDHLRGIPLDISIRAEFKYKNKKVEVEGFYDGDGIYKIRFMPDSEGEWSFTTASNINSLDRIEGKFLCVPPLKITTDL